jgi:hypothetical protein
MPIDRIAKVSSSSALRATVGNAVAFGYASDVDRFVSKDEAGTVRTLLDAGGAVIAKEVTFTETAGAGTYTGSVAVPAGATLIDVIVHQTALWDNAGAATLKVGIDGVDDDGIYTAVDLKATDLLAAESLSFAKAGGKEGIDITATHVLRRYSAAARVVSGIIITASTGGGAGRTRMVVLYVAPASSVDITAATKV